MKEIGGVMFAGKENTAHWHLDVCHVHWPWEEPGLGLMGRYTVTKYNKPRKQTKQNKIKDRYIGPCLRASKPKV